MENSLPSISYNRVQNNQRSHKHLRKKNMFNSKRKSWSNKSSAEYLPLLSGEDSDEEITLHDLSYLRNRQNKVESKSSNLQNAKIHRHSYSDPFLHCDFMTLELREGDTLQGIAIKYGCPISDLKRANNIISNQEFYGLRKLKIPVKKYSLLIDILPDTSGPSREEDNKRNSDNVKTISVGIGPMLSSSPTQEAAAFLKKMDEDLVKIMLNTNSRKDTLEEVTAALSESRIHPLVKNVCTTVDSIQWSYLLFAVIVIAVILPLIFVFYMYYLKPSSQTHHHEIYPDNVTLAAIDTTSKITDFRNS